VRGSDGAQVTVRDADIPEGDELTISYVNIHWPVGVRRDVLKRDYGFDCHCAKCVEELEEEGKKKFEILDKENSANGA